MPRSGSRIINLPIIPCERTKQAEEAIQAYAEALRKAAPTIGDHKLQAEQFWDSGLFRSAIERLRGQQSASMAEKRAFIEAALNYLESQQRIESWSRSEAEDRHDYELHLPSGRIAVIEAKGCLDGNNTNIFVRPPNADEFIIWSLCQNPGADPRHNAWSGIHTRLSAEIIYRRERVDGLIIWDMICGTFARPCPKLTSTPNRETEIGRYRVPPPCIYLFPRSIPDARSNPSPNCWRLPEVESLLAFHETFKGDPDDLVEVRLTASMKGATICRTTHLVRNGREVAASKPTAIRRAKA